MSRPRTSGFVLRDGTFIAVDDVEGMYGQGLKWLRTPQKVAGLMWSLGRDCVLNGRLAAAQGYFRKALACAPDDAGRARCLLSLGQALELGRDYSAAAQWYRKAFALPHGTGAVWYFLNNNLGYCLSRAGSHDEALGYCRAAIAIDPSRYNAHKNVGVALEGLGRFTEAARSYLRAAEICPADTRALQLLLSLMARYPHVASCVPDFPERLAACAHGLPQAASSPPPSSCPSRWASRRRTTSPTPDPTRR